jgi:hypothetical protein
MTGLLNKNEEERDVNRSVGMTEKTNITNEMKYEI